MNKLGLLPVVSEKAMGLAEASNQYTFLVPLSASKVEIGEEIKRSFKVKPLAINTVRIKGKPQATLVKRGSRRVKGQRNDFKKAYVTLAKGESIKVFEEKK